MIRSQRLLAALAWVALLGGLVSAQTPPRTPEQKQDYRRAMETADQKIADEVKAHSELVKNLEYLTTQIGPRLTGSSQMQQASEWTRKRFEDYGADSHLETTKIDHAWTRGAESAEITSPIRKRIGIHAFGWSKATNGDVSGKVVAIELKDGMDFDKTTGASSRRHRHATTSLPTSQRPTQIPRTPTMP